jgi:hypothetical protein
MDYIEYTSAMMNEMHDIVEELGLKKKKSNSFDLLDNMKSDLAFQTFIVSAENLSLATLVGYEMGIKYLEAAVYYSYLIALPSAEKQPSFFKSLLTKKDSSQIDYKNIVFKLHDFIMKTDRFGEFCEKWEQKVNEETAKKNSSDSLNLKRDSNLLQNIDHIFRNAFSVPIEHRVEVVEVGINTNLVLYNQEDDDEGGFIYKVLKSYFFNCQSWDEMLQKYDSFGKISTALFHPNTNHSNASVNAFMNLIVARKFVLKHELMHYGVSSITKDLVASFKNFDIEYKEEVDPPSVLL